MPYKDISELMGIHRFGSTDLHKILSHALLDLQRDERSDKQALQPFEGTTLYHPHRVLSNKRPSPDTHASQSQVSPKDQQPITLKWAVWRTDDNAQAQDQAALKWRVAYWRNKARQEVQQQKQKGKVSLLHGGLIY